MIDRFKGIFNNYNFADNGFIWKTEYEKTSSKIQKILDEETNTGEEIYRWTKLYKSDKKKFPLILIVKVSKETGEFTLSIRGSIRKWYLQENSRKDLNWQEFIFALKILSVRLKINFKRFLEETKVTQLEIGVTLLLKSNMRDINECYIKYRNAEREVFNKTTLYFKFCNYNLIFYDKFLEMHKNKINLNKIQKNVYKKFYFHRFEIQIKKMSGTTFKNKFNRLIKIINNWNEMPKIIKKYINEIEFVDVFAELKEIEINGITSCMKYLAFERIKEHKLINSINEISRKNPKNKSKFIKELLGEYMGYITQHSNLKNDLLLILDKKLQRLYNKGNNKYLISY